MGNETITVSKKSPCPFCGKPDWCYRFLTSAKYSDRKYYICVCNRTEQKTNVAGFDNVDYVYIGTTRAGAAMFVTREDHEIDRNEYLKAKGIAVSEKEQKHQMPKAAFQRASFVQSKAVPEASSVPPLPNERIDEISRYWFSQMRLSDFHREYYLKKQKWPQELLNLSGIRTFDGSREMIRKIEKRFGQGCLYGFPGASQQGGEWTISASSGIVIPVYDADGNIFRHRIRMDFLDTKRNLVQNARGEFVFRASMKDGRDHNFLLVPMKGVYEIMDDGTKVLQKDDTTGRSGKYRWLSVSPSVRKDGGIAHLNGCSVEAAPGLYAKGGDDPTMVYITEGELKCMVTNFYTNNPAISLPGVATIGSLLSGGLLDRLRNQGARLFVVGFDADKATNKAVMDFEKKLISELSAAGYPVGTVFWDESKGKGIDDALLNSGLGALKYQIV